MTILAHHYLNYAKQICNNYLKHQYLVLLDAQIIYYAVTYKENFSLCNAMALNPRYFVNFKKFHVRYAIGVSF